MFQRACQWLYSFYRKVFFGAGQDILKPKVSDNRLKDSLNYLDYIIPAFLDWLDTRVFFKNRKVRTSRGRVRSRAERNLTRYFDAHKIKYVYEKPLTLDRVTLHPDFFFPEYGVYVEFLGLIDQSDEYRRIYRLKKAVYDKHNVRVILVYPRHMRDIERAFPRLFREITGIDFHSDIASQNSSPQS